MAKGKENKKDALHEALDRAMTDAAEEKLREEVDTLIVIPNDRLLQISDANISVLEAFRAADQVLLSGVQGITELITTPGLINVDFNDVKSVMKDAGSALMGIGSATGEDRALRAVESAISSPLLEASIDGAHGVLMFFQGGSDLGLQEIYQSSLLVREAAHPEANIIFGSVIDDSLGDEIRVTVIAAGFDEVATQAGPISEPIIAPRPVQARPEKSEQQPAPQRRLGEVASTHTAAHRADPELPTRTNQIPIARPTEEDGSKEVPSSLEVPRVFEEEQHSDVLDIPDFLR